MLASPINNARSRPTDYPLATGYLAAFRILLYSSLALAAVFGGPVVRTVGICALPLALIGDLDGGVRHAFRLGGLTLAIWLAPRLGAPLGDLISGYAGVGTMVGNVAGMLVMGLAAVVVIGAVGAALSRRVKSRPHAKALNHMVGGLIGTAGGAAGVVVACWLLAALSGPIEALRQRIPAGASTPQAQLLGALATINTTIRSDPSGRWLVQNNPLEEAEAVQTMQLAVEIAAEPRRLLAAIDNGDLKEIAELPAVRKYVVAFENDPTMKEALRQADIGAILRSPHVQAMIADRALHDALRAHRDVLRRALSGRKDVAATADALGGGPRAGFEIRNWTSGRAP